MSIQTTKNESISALAERLWKQSGQPAGRDLEFWLQAETQVLAVPANGTLAADATSVLAASAASSTSAGRPQNEGRRQPQKGQPAPKKGGVRGR